jgi:CubicO group peptidase (beta-lactamase class C family)
MLLVLLRRRILLVLTMVLLVLVSGAIGIGLADWPFIERVWRVTQLADGGEWPEEFYRPVARIAATSSKDAYRPPLPRAPAAAGSIAPQALADAVAWAGANNSVALLVWHNGALQLERYWQGMSAQQPFSGRAMSRSLLGFMYGFAVADGKLQLDDPVQQYLSEWRNELRGAMTLRQLLQNTSGLEELPLNAVRTPAGAARWRQWLAFAQSYFDKNARLSLGVDFAHAALSFELAHEPGYRFALSNANAQLLGVVLERATGINYENYVEQKLWRPLGGSDAEFYMDRVNGMPAVYCCLRAAPEDFLRLGLLLAQDGQLDGQQLLPKGWIAAMARGSQANPLYGLQIWSGKAKAGVREYTTGSGQGVRHGADYLADDVIWMEGGGGRTVWAVPSAGLVIVRLGRASPGWDASVLPNLMLRGVAARR